MTLPEFLSKVASVPELAPPRVAFTMVEAAASIGMSEASFRRHVLPELRTIRAGPRLTLVRVAELDRYLERREALDNAI